MLLITPSEVLEIAFAPDIKLDNSIIRDSKIDIAQEHFLRAKLGDALLDKLTSGLNPDFSHSYIKPPLAYYIKYGLFDEIAVAVDTSGIIVRLGNSSNATSEIQNSAQNSSTAKDTQLKTGDNEIQTLSQKTANDTTKTTQKAYHNDVDEETINRSETTAPPLNNTNVMTTESERSLFISKNLEADNEKILVATASSTDTKTEALSQNTTTQKDGTASSTSDISRNDTNQSSQFSPASPTQIQLLKSRALSDANILMRKALRYIQANPTIFPDFIRKEHSIF